MKTPARILGVLLLACVASTTRAECGRATEEGSTVKAKIEVYFDIIAQWKAKNIEGVAAHLAPDIVWHTAAGIDPPLRGIDEARAWMQKYGSTVNNVRWRVVAHAETATQLFVEGIEDYEASDGTRIVFPYSGVYDFDGEKICGWRDYFDRGLMQRLKAGEPAPDFVRELNDRPAVRQ